MPKHKRVWTRARVFRLLEQWGASCCLVLAGYFIGRSPLAVHWAIVGVAVGLLAGLVVNAYLEIAREREAADA